ncbi:putative extracellular lipase [Talaromyces proteolyticus]|uniref:Extracellular lipase n=1 Tax=Talaromyces proteolyticus TaxID=1131652 RepID=A0AAD4Q3E3_9EURO|nr:putative extracellular lipase [Talaromyces proteolyticus]KAH8704964.1 putative extracellular lipase [Talaromyces proteolyticus]
MKLSALVWLSAGLALPGMAAPTPIMRRTISSSLLDELDLFAQYSAASYCSANLDSTGSALACSAGNCPLVEAADTTILYDFDESNSFGDATGYIAVDKTNELIILAFRGSSDLSNWIANIDATLTDLSSICSGCEVHSGWWSAWGTVSSAITTQIESALGTYSGYTFVATGHSLGGALAAIAATVFRASGYTVELYDYGQPRIGNLALATYITNQNQGSNYRVTHSDDIVPKLPPKFLGYDHFSPEYWIASGDNVTVTDSDVDEVVGIDSTNGNDGTSGDSTSAHSWYIIDISACS